MKPGEFIKSDPAWAAFLAFSFLSMVSMPLARGMLVVSLVSALATRAGRRRFRLVPPAAGWLLYLALAIVVSSVAAACCDDPLLVPRRGLHKLPKLLWFVSIPLAASLATTRERLRDALAALALGGAALAVFTLVSHPAIAWLQVHFPAPGQPAAGLAEALRSAAAAVGLDGSLSRALSSDVWAPWGGRPPSFYYAFTTLATLHDAQRFMVALILLLCLLPATPRHEDNASRTRRIWWTAAALAALGLIASCKRGPLLVGLLVSGVILAARIRAWKAIALLAAACLVTLAVPQARARLAALPAEFQMRTGGRALMWTRIVPALHREHPFGIGFRALTTNKMRAVDKHVERNRTHVHSTPLQAFVDFGYPGVAAWALWLLLSLGPAIRLARSGGRDGPPLLAAPLAAVAALHLFGLVEYNIADAAVVVFYGELMGLACPYFLDHGDGRPCEIAFLEKVFLKRRRDGRLRGVELFNLGLVRDLAAAGHRVYLPVHPSWVDAIATATGGSPVVKVRCVQDLAHPAATALGAALGIVSEARACGRFQVLFVANNTEGLAPSIRLLWRARAFRRFVLFAHKVPSRRFVAAVADLPGAIVCVCGFIANVFRGGHVAASVHADYGVANADAFFPPSDVRAPDSPMRVCLLGDMRSDWKGADTAIAAIGLLPAGYRGRIELHVKAFPDGRTFPDGSGIVSHPWSDAADIPAFLREMDVLLAPSRNRDSDGRLMETFSQTTVQGMLTGLPVIHTSIPPFVEKFDDGGGIRADTPKEIAAALVRLADDPALRARLGREARATALSRYVWDTSRFYARYFA